MTLPLLAAIGDAMNGIVTGSHRLSGGDVAQAHRVELDDGRVVFAKTHESPPARFFDTEARGLRWLADASAMPIAQVLAVADQPVPFLVLEWINESPNAPADEAGFGRSLALLHGAGAPTFGRLDRRTTGSRALPNDPCDNWALFYATQRLLPLARLGRDDADLEPAMIARLERLAGRLEHFGLVESPSRLHGDLWAGNRLVDERGVSWLIDPAAHGGHREFDLAMMRLFGGFGDSCFAAYAEQAPLQADWEDRVRLHQIAPLVVHAIKFGGSYVDAAAGAISYYS